MEINREMLKILRQERHGVITGVIPPTVGGYINSYRRLKQLGYVTENLELTQEGFNFTQLILEIENLFNESNF